MNGAETGFSSFYAWRLDVHLHFSKVARGPAWERWMILEEQHGDAAFAGEAILTYTDIGTYANVECDILFAREFKEGEAEELLNAACSILSGRGNINIYTAGEVVSEGFNLMEGVEGGQN